jgi:hypothetical protein
MPNFDEFMTKTSVENHNTDIQYFYKNPHGRRKHKKFINETMSIISIPRKTPSTQKG